MSDWAQGTIVLDSGQIVASPTFVLGCLETSGLSLRREVIAAQPFMVKIGIGPVTLDNYEIHLTEYYDNDMLKHLCLILSEDAAVRQFGTTDRLTKELAFYNTWFKRKLGRDSPLRFRWGTVGVLTDPWTLEPYISFRYRCGQEL